ncbi:MAG: hypothetical protein IJW01_07980 [Paludibacteraceae bacterium]|nr:hypothetical protein [Paludibacteraceae bacterium]
MKNNDIIYSICVEDIQNEALNEVGEKLNKDELSLAIKLLQYSLGENMIILYKNLFKEVKTME